MIDDIVICKGSRCNFWNYEEIEYEQIKRAKKRRAKKTDEVIERKTSS